MPSQGWPRGPNPQKQLDAREIPLKIVQLTKSKVKEPLLNLGFTGMQAKGRESLLKDINAKRFRLVREDVDSDMERQEGDEADVGSSEDGNNSAPEEGSDCEESANADA